jgi:hypothetical protein
MMADWYCFRDKVMMEDADIKMSYLRLSQRVPGLRCPVCGDCYLTEETVMTTVKAAEEIFEGK